MLWKTNLWVDFDDWLDLAFRLCKRCAMMSLCVCMNPLVIRPPSLLPQEEKQAILGAGITTNFTVGEDRLSFRMWSLLNPRQSGQKFISDGGEPCFTAYQKPPWRPEIYPSTIINASCSLCLVLKQTTTVYILDDARLLPTVLGIVQSVRTVNDTVVHFKQFLSCCALGCP